LIEHVFDTWQVSPRVVLQLVRELADLHAWGRSGGGWWGLVSWTTYGTFADGVNGYLHTSAWVPARFLEPSADPELAREYQAVQRFDLPADRSAWPCPAGSTGRRWRHCGALEAAPPAPEELTPLPGAPASRRPCLPAPPLPAPPLPAPPLFGTSGERRRR